MRTPPPEHVYCAPRCTTGLPQVGLHRGSWHVLSTCPFCGARRVETPGYDAQAEAEEARRALAREQVRSREHTT